MRVKRWESKDTAVDVQTKNVSRRAPGGIQEENVVGDEGQMEEDELPTMAEKNAEKVWKALRSILEHACAGFPQQRRGVGHSYVKMGQ